MTDNERHIIISVDLDANPGTIRVDLGTLAPHIAYALLQQALDALECTAGADVTIIHQGSPVEMLEAFDSEE
jgi:hypothetical protein